MKTKTKTTKTTTKKAVKVNYEEMYKSMSTLFEDVKDENVYLLSKNITRRDKINELNGDINDLENITIIYCVGLFIIGIFVGLAL